MELLEGMLEEYQNDNKQVAQITLEIALNHKDANDFEKAIAVMEDIKTSDLTNGQIRSRDINLAKVYWEANEYTKAVASYKKMADAFSNNQRLHSNALKSLAQVYLEMGEIEKSSETWEKLLWNPEDPQPYFRNQMHNAQKLNEAGKHAEALMVFEKLLIRIRDHPDLVKEVQNMIDLVKKN
jgi:tetratricopeptide (TPR) repeat protein